MNVVGVSGLEGDVGFFVAVEENMFIGTDRV